MLSRPTRQRQTISKRRWWLKPEEVRTQAEAFSSADATETMKTGPDRVQRADGYGFITRSGGSDVFEHMSGLERSGLTHLSEGDRVLFDLAESRKGPEAAKVRLV